jgi:DNA transformation protein
MFSRTAAFVESCLVYPAGKKILPGDAGAGQLPKPADSAKLANVPDDSFKEFVLDQLHAVPELGARAMFGAHGLYAGETFFAILDEGRLFFKTNAAAQAEYLARGMGPFSYESRGKRLMMSYHEVPPDVLENAPELTLWARKAIAVAVNGKKRPKSIKPRRMKDKSN